MKKKILPPTYFWILILLSLATQFVFKIGIIIEFPFNLMGGLFIIFGITINLVTDNLFKKNKTTVKPNKKPTSLIIKGPFNLSRHPMYLGMVSILIGESIIIGTLVSFIFPILFIIIMNHAFIPMEEENLEKVFSKDYPQYKKKVRKWI